MKWYCTKCAKQVPPKTIMCKNCYNEVIALNQKSNGLNKTVAAILALLFGGLGIHRFYLGKALTGFLYLLFFWSFIPAFLGLIESIVLFLMTEHEFNQEYNKG